MAGRFWISVVVMFVLSIGIGFVAHAMLLHGDYAQLPSLFRTEEDAQGHFPWMVLAHVLTAFGITWIYRKGREPEKPFLGQGLRFGLAIVVLMTIPVCLIYFAVQPWPGAVVCKQIAYGAIGMLVMGVAVAAINQEPKQA